MRTTIARVIEIPTKRHSRQLHLLPRRATEITALLEAADRASWLGRRDHALLLTAIHDRAARLRARRACACSDVIARAGRRALPRDREGTQDQRCAKPDPETVAQGLVWAVRDPAGSDPGAGDRRLLALEPEFVSVLKSAGREISTLSPTLRSAWDGRPLQLLTRTAPARSTDAHIALIGHITQAELRHHLTQVELANGLANRFLLCACRRTRLLPEGGNSDPLHGTGLTRMLAARSDTPAPPGAYA